LRLRRTLIAVLTMLFVVPAAAQAFTTGVADEQVAMFASKYYQALHVKIVRYITPYDTADSPQDLADARAWMQTAQASGKEILVAFYHSRKTPTRMPSQSLYRLEVKRFMADFPLIHEYQPWNEANRGYVSEPNNGSFASPTAKQSAQYYLALKGSCPKCIVLGLDVLDTDTPVKSVAYINQFKSYVGKRNMPNLWGLHNYSDTNRFRDYGTTLILNAVPGNVWLTETGGIYQFGGSFPANQKRAAKALSFMFTLAGRHHRITRLYIYNWTGGPSSQRFDAGLTNPNGSLRCGYYVVAKQLTGKGSVPKSCK
jgi:hypothetical protein